MSEKSNIRTGKALFYDSVYTDWAVWLGLVIGFATSQDRVKSSYLSIAGELDPSGFGTAELIGSIIDSMVGVGISFFLFSGLAALIRRKLGSDLLSEIAAFDKPKLRYRKQQIFAMIFVASIASVVVALAQSGATISGVFDGESTTTRCQPQGADEICLTVKSGRGSLVEINYQLNYSSTRQLGDKVVSASSWSVAFDCSTQDLQVSNVQLLDRRKLPIVVPSEVTQAMTDGLSQDLSLLLDYCG